MQASKLKQAILSGGLDEALAGLYGAATQAERQRYAELVEKFIGTFGDRDVAVFSAPGRSEICGNHTDHNHGRVLACAVNLDILAVAAKNDDARIRVASVGFDAIDIDAAALSPDPAEQGDASAIVRGVAAGMAARGCPVGGFDAITVSRVPAGSGLSSSAAFEVILAKILDTLYGDGTLDPTEAAKLSQAAERDFFGKPCGLMDQMACACGGFVAIDFDDPASPAVERLSFDPAQHGYRLFVVNTGGSHANLTGDYAAVRAEMGAVARYFGKEALRDCDEAGFYANLPRIREKCGDRAALRAMHFFAENRRVERQEAAIRAGDIDAFLRVANESGDSSCMYLQNAYAIAHPAAQGVTLGIAAARHLLGGAGAARVHGGGFAGTMQAFVPEAMCEHFAEEMGKIFGKKAVYALDIRASGPCCLAR